MKEPRSILVVTLSNIGDVVMTTPVIMALAGRFPEARITVVVGPKAKPVIEKSRHIHRIVVYDKKADLMGKWRFLLELWKDRYDWAVDLRNTAIPFLICAPKHSPLFRKFTKTNMRERHLEVLEMLGPQAEKGDSPFIPFQFFDKSDEAACLAKLKERGITQGAGWVLIAPGAASGRKRWGAEHFREIASELSAKTGKQILLVGSKEEHPIADGVAEKLGVPALNLCGDLTLSETAFLISRASILIANDSAIMHIGFETGTATVGLFGPTDHEKYGHAGPKFRIAREDAQACGCHSERLPYAERSCFHGLKPGKVLELCTELLAQGPGSFSVSSGKGACPS